jgi:putative transcriptional regulator
MKKILVSFFLLPLLSAQSTHTKALGAGRLLVASRDLSDPNFAQTVVLLVHHDEDEGVLGLIINRRTKLPISRAFQELPAAKGRTDPVYAGGPVERTAVLALVRSDAKTKGGESILADVSMISSEDLLEKTLAAGPESKAFHVYLGYSGWTAKQLEREVELGAWYIFPGESALVFDPNPESLWSRLIRRTEERIAGILPATEAGKVYPEREPSAISGDPSLHHLAFLRCLP